MKILVIQQKMIGDVLTSSILFEALRDRFPEAVLHYLIHKHTFPVVENNPFIDKFILFDPAVHGRPLGLSSMLRKIRKQEYEIVIDVYAKINTALISGLSGASKKISFYKRYTSVAYTHKFEPRTMAKTAAGLAIENRMLLLRAISEDFPREIRPKIYLIDSEKASAKTFLTKAGISGEKPLFMISILGSSAEKTYPIRYMAEILKYIISINQESQILFNYIPGQEKKAKQLYDLCPEDTQQRIFFEVYGKSLREFIAITSQCNAVIGNEGGAVNMAKALRVPVFSIFSPSTKKEIWSTYEDDVQNVSVHIQDYHQNRNVSTQKNNATAYQEFKPHLFKRKLKDFLKEIIIAK